jgi:predicted nucleotidyltransferase
MNTLQEKLNHVNEVHSGLEKSFGNIFKTSSDSLTYDVGESLINPIEGFIKTIYSVKECQLIGSYYLGVATVNSDLDVVVMLDDAHLIINKLKVNSKLTSFSLKTWHIPNVDYIPESNNSRSFDPDKHLGLVKIKTTTTSIDILVYDDPVKFEAAKFANEASYVYNKLNQGELIDRLNRVNKFTELFYEYLKEVEYV